jgi:hypothetical protein
MERFHKAEPRQLLNLENIYSKKIILSLQTISDSFIYTKRDSRKPNSMSIKYCLINLGHQLGFKVYANGLKDPELKEQQDKFGFVNREFLYDIHWYQEVKNEFYMPSRYILVAESELGDRRKGDTSHQRNPAVKFDFQKLLVANADLRLLIFKVKKVLELEELSDYFEKAMKNCKSLHDGSIILFACFVYEIKSLLYTEKKK